MKATEQYFPVVLFIMLYKVVLTFESVDEILKCDHSNESYWAVLSCGTVYYAVKGGSNFWVCEENITMWPFKWNLLSSIFFTFKSTGVLLWKKLCSDVTKTKLRMVEHIAEKRNIVSDAYKEK